MSAARCHCCGGVPDTQDTKPSYCRVCRESCKLVAHATILRGTSCPFISRRGSARSATERFRAGEGVPIDNFFKQGSFPRLKPQPEPDDGTFVWRGRRRRNVPGG